MRIIIDLQPCQNGSRRRGIGRYSMAMTRAMIQLGRGHEFIVVLNESFENTIGDVRRELADLLPQEAFAVFSVSRRATAADPANAWRNRAAEMARSHFLESLSPDLVFLPSINEGLWDETVVSVEQNGPYPTAVTLYDLIPLEDPQRYLGAENDYTAYLRRLNQMRHADLILPISEYVAKDSIARLHLQPERVVTIPCGVEPFFVPPGASARPRATFLAEYGIARPYVMTACPLEPRKNLEGLIAGFASMGSEVRDAHQLVLAGRMDAFARTYLGNLARDEGLADDALVFAGFVPDSDLPELYHHSSVFAFPSFSEGFGLPLLEAMACGAPVVGSDRTSIPEVVGRQDLLCDPANAIDIGRKIERILSDARLQAELRTFGPDRAAGFTWEKSASDALDAFEKLHANAKEVSGVATAHAGFHTGESPWRTLAFVMAAVPVEHRLAGINDALAAALADVFDLTVIDTGFSPRSGWVSANCAIHDVDWFESHAHSFDHILYSTDFMANAAFRQLMARHGGSVILADRLSMPAQAQLVGRRIFDGAQVALYEQEGLGALLAAAEDDLTAQDVSQLLHRDIVGRTGQVFTETDSRFPSADPSIGILPAALTAEAQTAFQARLTGPVSSGAEAGSSHDDNQATGLAEPKRWIVAMPADEKTARRLVQAYRQMPSALAATHSLLVFLSDTQAGGLPILTRLFGNILCMSGDLDALYCGLLANADLVILDDALPDRVKAHVMLDAERAQVLAITEGDTLAGYLSDLLIAATPTDPALHVQGGDITGTARSGQIAATLLSDMQPVEPNAMDRALDMFARNLPAEVRGITPDSHDLAELSENLARNEAHLVPAQLYVDVTAFAGPRFGYRIDLASRMWLKAFFRQAGKHVTPVYANGDHFVVAHRFAATICGVDTMALPDRAVVPTPGDRIIGFDLLQAFADTSFEALRTGLRHGLAPCYVALGALALDREELLLPLADLLLAWCRDVHLSPVTTIAALPQPAEAPQPYGKDHERIAAIEAAGITMGVLLCEGLPAGVAPTVALSPAVMEAYARWETAGRNPACVPSRKSGTATDFGHVITGHLLGSYSLAIINRMMAITLEANYPGQVRFLPVETVPIDHTEGVPTLEKPLMMELSARPPLADRAEIVISHHYPILAPKGNYKLALAMFFWEESHVPVDTIKLLADSFDAIISPARSVTSALINSGLHIPVATIGQPVDIDRYAALAASRRPRQQVTTFLHVSSCFKRKGIDVLLTAWAEAFTSADNVRLVIKTFPNPHNDAGQQVAALRELHPQLAPIEIISRDVEIEEMPQFYADADVMVLPTRGEGYNLPALEAMAAGLPLIVTGYGGHRDFCGEDQARLIAYRFAPSESHVSDHHSMWLEPDVNDLVDALREQINPTQFTAIETRRQNAITAAMRESNETAWLHRYNMMIAELQKNAHNKPPRIAWISTWAVQCGIAQYSGYLLDHFSEAARSQVLIVCDNRTEPDADSAIAFSPVWDAQNIPKAEQILESIEACGAEAVVIQHQDGLISWQQLGRIAHDRRLANKTTIAILHNAGNLMRSEYNERMKVIEGLAKLTRILVHNIADVNFLAGIGLQENVGLLPHGAFARDQAPWPRRLGVTEAPVIGCHGFFFRHKGIDKLIRAVAILRQEWPRLRLRLINARFPGESHDAFIRECKQLAASLGMADAIEWHQDFLPIEQVDALLAGCDVIALPYDESDDSASGAVRVSLTSMVPLVATKVKIFAELGDAAEWAASNDPEVLADTLTTLLRSPERRRTVQAAMHEWLVAHDWSRVADMLEGQINGLVKQKRLEWDFARNA
jgi:glycosyltransferase involved in cell wall biosynthesis